MNIAHTIIPKSDRINADDLLAAPRTIKIASVGEGPAEGPVAIHYEGENGRPYLPCKSMRRVLVTMWGAEGAAYVGKRLTLYCDKSVKFGGEEVGGIRISHADISEPLEIKLTATRGKRKPFRVEPLPPEKAAAPTVAQSATVAPTDLAPYEITGREQAALGNDALAAWWATVPTKVKVALKTKLDAEWKPIAAKVSGGAS